MMRITLVFKRCLSSLAFCIVMFFACYAVVFLFAPAEAQTSAAPDPEHETVELENEQVRVIRIRIPPHSKSPMHAHSNRVVIPLTMQRSKATTSEGQIDERSRRPGQVFWANANMHMTENLSDNPLETIIVEIKVRSAK